MEQLKSNSLSFRLRRAIVEVLVYLKGVLDLREGVDKEGTREGIVADVEFKGHGAWILLFAALMASIGLSIGSTAVIIGAMLVSPLMGPILGIGFAAATNDFELLTKSLKNFGISVLISILISTIYFLILPVPEVNAELIDRKTATLLAIAIAFFGGAAGIIAGSRSFKSNVVPGVAIATALMPPLCTVGYGMATLQMDFMLGALYLFFINSVFIALPTYLYIRYQHFPMIDFIDPQKEKKMKRYILAFLVVTMIPSAFIFVDVLSKSFFTRNAQMLIAYVNSDLEQSNTLLVSSQIDIDTKPRKVVLALMGDVVSEDKKKYWLMHASEIGLEDCEIDIREQRDFTTDIAELRNASSVEALKYNQQFMQDELHQKSAEIDSLQRVIQELKPTDSTAIAKQVLVLFQGVKDASFSKLAFVDREGATKASSTLLVRWKRGLSEQTIAEEQLRMKEWLGVVFPNEKLDVMTLQ